MSVIMYSGCAIALSFSTRHVLGIAAVVALMVEADVYSVEVKPGQVRAVVLLRRDEDISDRADELISRVRPYALKGDVEWDAIEAPVQEPDNA